MRLGIFQERHHDYVLGPNQDSRLASVASGAVIKGIDLRTDTDAPFELRGRAVRQQYNSSLQQNGLQGLKTMWTGPNLNYKQQDFVLESLQMAYFGQGGNPKKIYPSVAYPPGAIIRVDLINSGPSALTNLTFYWRGVKLFPWGTVPAYRYPPKFSGLTFNEAVSTPSLPTSGPTVGPLAITIGGDADIVVRAGQAGPVTAAGGNTVAEICFQLMDFRYKPFSNDLVQMDILFGSALGNAGVVRNIPIGPTPSFTSWFGPGPALPGLIYPEIYVPKNHQLFYTVKRADSTIGGTASAKVIFNLIGAKVFEQ